MTTNDSIDGEIDGGAKSGRDKAAELSAKARSGYASVKNKANERAASARKQASDAYDRTLRKSSALYADGKAKANAGYERGKQQFSSTPLAVLAGGLALGAIVGALIPESQREKRAMGSAGRKINGRAKEAVTAAKERGSAKVEELGLNGEALKKQMEEFVSKGVEILKSAGQAASDAAAHKD